MLKIELAQRIITMYHGKEYDENDVDNIEKISLKEIYFDNMTFEDWWHIN